MQSGRKSAGCGRRATRRELLKAAALGLGGIAGAPYLVPASVLGAAAPSSRIQVGLIGAGNQSTIDLPALLDQDDTDE